MEEYFKIKTNLEDQGYSNIEMIAGGLLFVGTDASGTVCVFNAEAIRINTEDSGISIEKDSNEGEYTITINSYSTKYKISE